MTDTTTPEEAAFAKAVWAFKRRERTTEPTAEEFGLAPSVAESIAHQCHIEFERKVKINTGAFHVCRTKPAAPSQPKSSAS